MIIKLDMIQSIALGVVVLLVGKFLVDRISILRKYCLPEPVVGGTLFAILALIFKQTGTLEIVLDTTLQDFMMTVFFTSVGFSASFRMLKKGGLKVAIFLGAAVGLVVLQNVLGVALTKIFDLNPLLGLATGSIPMTGGHGTSAAFGPDLVKLGAINANSVALASATFGLIAGSMIGGPTANRLISKNTLKTEVSNKLDSGMEIDERLDDDSQLKEKNFTIATFELLLAMGIGTIVTKWIQDAGITLPGYIGAMLIGAFIRNLSEATGKFDVPMVELDILGGIALSLFLSMALMGLKLWELADLAVPLIVMLLSQVILTFFYSSYVTFRVLGSDYDAAVITAGHCGFAMGATPNGIANMTSVVGKFGPSPTAFFVMPVVGSLFIDFFNSGVIAFFMNILV
ncbi:MAG: sodium/glutamate symporter [Tissierellaceae bacterium]|nr:sodium/glutamate symporter [Tissierellaceae bacterium]